jgi:hypothetical protein
MGPPRHVGDNLNLVSTAQALQKVHRGRSRKVGRITKGKLVLVSFHRWIHYYRIKTYYQLTNQTTVYSTIDMQYYTFTQFDSGRLVLF